MRRVAKPRFGFLLSIMLSFIGPLSEAATVSQGTLLEKQFAIRAEGESILDLWAAAPGTSWSETGREAAVITLYVDGRYNQDIPLFRGALLFRYEVVLGNLPVGKHVLRIDLNSKLSAAGASSVTIASTAIKTVTPIHPEYAALSHSPILYARSDSIGRFTDIPLLMWYEIERSDGATVFRYSIIFSNEDGGTPTDALMSRWGRATDIEWVYQVKRNARGRIIEERFQGVNHALRDFRGERQGSHPLLMVASRNNNFSDRVQPGMRIALRPVRFNLDRYSREELMDRNPWTYQVMTEELAREGKILRDSPPASALESDSPDSTRIVDPRQYLFVDGAVNQTGTAVSILVKLKRDLKWHSSDLGMTRLRIDRSGYFRTAVRLPERISPDEIVEIAVRCDETRSGIEAVPECNLIAINKVFLLEEGLKPGKSIFSIRRAIKLQHNRITTLFRRTSHGARRSPFTIE